MVVRRQKLSTRVIIYCSVLVIALSLVLGCLGYYIYYTRSMSSYRMYIESTLNIVNSSIDADDMRECIRLRKASEQYRQTQQRIDDIKTNTMVSYIYLITPMDINDPSKILYISVAYTPEEYRDNTQKIVQICEPVQEDAFDEEMERVFSDTMFGEKDISYVSNSAGFGNMLTGTKPVVDSEGNTVCLICVDFSMEEIYGTLFDYLLGIILGAVITAVLVLIVIVRKINYTIVNPVRNMALAAQDFVAQSHTVQDPAQLSYKSVEVQRNDEIRLLSDNINNMVSDMIDFMRNLTTVTEDKQRISVEFHVAAQIQDSMIPSLYPAFPERSEFDIYGKVRSCKKMGGAFYDHFFIDKTHLVFFMGDISHTGVSAALMMVITCTIIKDFARLGYGVDKVFSEVNSRISSSNQLAGVKITAFMGIIDIQTGIMSYVNAGGFNPFIKKSGKEFELLPCKTCFELGSMANVPYWGQNIQLVQGDVLFMYTGGLIEASDHKGDVFSQERLSSELNIQIGRKYAIQDLAEAIEQSVLEFMNGKELENDIAMLLFRYLG